MGCGEEQASWPWSGSPGCVFSSFPALLLPAWSLESLKLYVGGYSAGLPAQVKCSTAQKKKKFLNFDFLLSERMKVSHAEVEDHSV